MFELNSSFLKKSMLVPRWNSLELKWNRGFKYSIINIPYFVNIIIMSLNVIYFVEVKSYWVVGVKIRDIYGKGI